MQPSNEKKYALQERAIEIANSPKEGRLFDRLKSREVQDPVDFTFTVSDPGSKVKKGQRVSVYVKFMIGCPNPKSRTFIRGEQWYFGNLVIPADPARGTASETRGFVLEVLSRTGMLSKRGKAFGIIPDFSDEGLGANEKLYSSLFEIKE